MRTAAAPALSGIAVNWHDEPRARQLLQAWPVDPRFELILVDNGSRQELATDQAKVLVPKRNLGFAGAVNLGIREARAPLVLILNSDVRPEPGALEQLLAGFERFPQAAGLAPKLIDSDNRCQCRWQLRPLPTPTTLLLQALMIPSGQGSKSEPELGALVEQPAAAALALRREALERVGGLDESFYPAWFEDVDLAIRLSQEGYSIRYWPQARFLHHLGASAAQLGYGSFLWIYYANLCRYLRKHHALPMPFAARCLLVATSLLRLTLLPVRTPKLARGRMDAAGGLLVLALGALSGWRLPSGYPPEQPLETATGDR